MSNRIDGSPRQKEMKSLDLEEEKKAKREHHDSSGKAKHLRRGASSHLDTKGLSPKGGSPQPEKPSKHGQPHSPRGNKHSHKPKIDPQRERWMEQMRDKGLTNDEILAALKLRESEGKEKKEPKSPRHVEHKLHTTQPEDSRPAFRRAETTGGASRGKVEESRRATYEVGEGTSSPHLRLGESRIQSDPRSTAYSARRSLPIGGLPSREEGKLSGATPQPMISPREMERMKMANALKNLGQFIEGKSLEEINEALKNSEKKMGELRQKQQALTKQLKQLESEIDGEKMLIQVLGERQGELATKEALRSKAGVLEFGLDTFDEITTAIKETQPPALL